MLPFSADPFRSASAKPVDSALTSFADEVCATVARTFAYVGTLALIGILAVRGCDQLLIMLADAPVPDPGWTVVDRPDSASAKQTDFIDKTEAYRIFRDPQSGSKNMVRLAGGPPTPSEDWLITPKRPPLRGAL
jgi:hypothetical protein